MDNYLLYITASNQDEAKQIAKSLLEEKLVACTNILPGSISLYWWEEKIEESEEVILITKTRKELISQIKTRVKELHSYDCPCIVALKIEDGNEEFLDWINSVTT